RRRRRALARGGCAERRDRRRPRRLLDLGRRLRAAHRRARPAGRHRRPRSRAGAAVQVRRDERRRNRGRPVARARARPRARIDAGQERADGPPHLYGDARAAEDRRGTRLRAALLGARRVKIVVGHLYPDYLNIYADRGNIAVLARRAVWRGHELEVSPLSLGDPVVPGEHDLLYVGGGQDREQALVAEDLVAKRDGVVAAVRQGAAVLAVCGGYQLLGRSYRDSRGTHLPGLGLFPLETVAGETRMI